MTPLGDRLARQIAAAGPMRLSDYMAACLTDPQHGYYTTRDPLGAGGDFTTAPEISQMFGECLGLCLAQAWADRRGPAPFALAELGPGRGTLMADILRATARALPAFAAAARVHLVETSPALRARQRAALGTHPAVWADRVEDLPDGPLWLVANEFLDALPIRQFVRRGAGWAEVMVGLSGDDPPALAPRLAPPVPVPALAHRLSDTREGDVVEWNPAAEAAVAAVAARIAQGGGVAIFIDYGAWQGTGDTFQALRGHVPADPFAAPGTADLTAHVAFAPLAAAARAAGAAVAALTPQGVLLERLGIAARAEALARGLTGDRRTQHLAAHRRLTHPEEMGSLFQALALHAPGTPPPPGFDPSTPDRP